MNIKTKITLAWTLRKNDVNKLQGFEMKCLKHGGQWVRVGSLEACDPLPKYKTTSKK